MARLSSPWGVQPSCGHARKDSEYSPELLPLRQQIVAIRRREPDCKALQHLYGIGPLLGEPAEVGWGTRDLPRGLEE